MMKHDYSYKMALYLYNLGSGIFYSNNGQIKNDKANKISNSENKSKSNPGYIMN